MTSTATLRYTASPEQDRRVRIARVAAAGRVAAARKVQEARREQERAAWLRDLAEGSTEEYCHICRRCTDHRGEHSPEQIDAWKAGQA